ncbi:nuclear transport factor 2 family protein [Mycobacterium sp.]|uniref:nuclear transport factor 2 family protein n=1 Tax=Mycobacterium sp. TaxID=1785 RepID=UPI002D9CC206|nr:nuclear transport factor 2 family protein [Mycobacterium sp.]
MQSTPTAVAQRLYAAFASGEGQALFDLLTNDFVGTVSTGMPHGVGGDHQGRVDMITEVWGRIASLYDMHVEPTEYLPVDDERVVVLGKYWGPARDGGSSVDATFAHIITTRGDRVAALQQITDTARWRIPTTA